MKETPFLATAIPVAAATFATMFGLGMLVPAMPQLAGGGADGAIAAGGLVSVFGLARLLVNWPAGILADRFGIVGTAALGLVILGVGAALGIIDLGYAGLLAALALQGAGSAIFGTAAMTSLIIRAGANRRGAAMSWFQGALLLSMAIGPVIGGRIVETYGPRSPFLIEAVLSIVAMIALRFMPEGRASKPGQSPVSARSLMTHGLVGGALVGFAAFFTRTSIAWNVVPTIAVAQFALSPTELGQIVGAGTLANLLVMPLGATLIDNWGPRRTSAACAAICAAGLLLLLAAPSVAMLWLSVAIMMAATGVLIPAAGAIVMTTTPREATGRAMGLFRTFADMGMTVGPLAVPATIHSLQLPAIDGVAVAAALLVIATMLMTMISIRAAQARVETA